MPLNPKDGIGSYIKDFKKSKPPAKSCDDGEKASQPIALKQSTIISAVALDVSIVTPGETLSFLKKRFPASTIS